MIGQVFWQLTVKEPAGVSKQGHLWRCVCSCGNQTIVPTSRLKAGRTKSCGCRAYRSGKDSHSYRHGFKGTTEYVLWHHAKRRAKRRGLAFDLTPADIKIPEICPVLGIKITPGSKRLHDNSPSVDRKRNNLGYTRDNIWVISYKANRLKADATADFFDENPEEYEYNFELIVLGLHIWKHYGRRRYKARRAAGGK